jgi:hypothetical protein
MLATRTLKRTGPFESIRADSLQFPLIMRSRSHDRNPPIPKPISEHMFYDRSNICLHVPISGVLYLH